MHVLKLGLHIHLRCSYNVCAKVRACCGIAWNCVSTMDALEAPAMYSSNNLSSTLLKTTYCPYKSPAISSATLHVGAYGYSP